MKQQNIVIQEFIQVHGNLYDYSKFEYKGCVAKSVIICKLHGEFLQNANNHLNGQDCPKCKSFTDKDLIVEKLQQNGYEIISFDYSNIIVKDTYGSYRTTASRIRNNTFPSIITALDKTKVFINKSNAIHDFKYNYNLANYGNNKSKVKIICLIHGLFLQTPAEHINAKSGCPECACENKGWTKTKFKEFCTKNNSSIFYILYCWNETEEFYKLGITSKSIKERYKSIIEMPYEYAVVQEIRDIPENIWELELLCKRYTKSNNLRYIPKLSFGGSLTEVYKLC